jgi:hypothetical protein
VDIELLITITAKRGKVSPLDSLSSETFLCKFPLNSAQLHPSFGLFCLRDCNYK